MSDTITATMARWAADLEYDDIGQQARHEARRYLLDSLGCAFGGYQSLAHASRRRCGTWRTYRPSPR